MIILSFYLAYRVSNRVVEPLNEIDLDHPETFETYEELEPLMNRLTYHQKQIHNKEEELKQKRNEFITATENLNEGLVLLNKDGVILSINDFACKLLNISSYAVGKDLLLFNNSIEVQELLNKASAGLKTEMVVPIKDNDYEFYASPIVSKEKVNGIALLIIDISEKEKAEQMRKEFTANVSHELKTPLTSITIMLDNMIDNPDMDNIVRDKFIRQIKRK